MNEEKIEKNKRKLFDRLRKLNSITSEEKLIELEELFRLIRRVLLNWVGNCL